MYLSSGRAKLGAVVNDIDLRLSEEVAESGARLKGLGLIFFALHNSVALNVLTSADLEMRAPRYLRLLLRPPTLNFEEAAWELLYLAISPKRVYKSLYFRQQAKNQWARDDPSFVVLLSVLLAVSALAWGFAYAPNVLGILKLILYMVVVDFLAVGVLISTAAYVFVNKVIRKPGQHSEVPLEWAYCFDVHCNSFLVVFLWLYVVQFLCLPLVNRLNWASIFLGNTLYFVAYSHYSVMTFLGYSNLPFLHNTQLFLVPIALAFAVYIGSLVLKVSIVRLMLEQYFE